MSTTSIALPDRIQLAGPSPLSELRNLSNVLNGVRVFIKREDLGYLGCGGNKLRKLECLVAEALAQGCDTLISFGALQSNHARTVSAVAASLSLECELILSRKVPRASPFYELSGNLLLENLFGAKLHVLEALDDVQAVAAARIASLKAQGRKPFVIPFGGSDALGAIGYSSCIKELKDQSDSSGLRIDHLYHASGSGGTQAGLLLGNQLHQTDFPICGISVMHNANTLHQIVGDIRKQANDHIGLSLKPTDQAIVVDDRFVGPGYGIPDERTLEALRLIGNLEGIALDPVYTGKALAGLICHVREGQIKEGQNVVFLHTGGLPGLFAYTDAFNFPH